MVGSSKILTVSYGTFSCTLEGFDDPFVTMKSIAEYFRDLAADDRFFGAEPPQPDVQYLHSLAQKNTPVRVEAEVEENGLRLRQEGPSDDAPMETSLGGDADMSATEQTAADPAHHIVVPTAQHKQPEPTAEVVADVIDAAPETVEPTAAASAKSDDFQSLVDGLDDAHAAEDEGENLFEDISGDEITAVAGKLARARNAVDAEVKAAEAKTTEPAPEATPEPKAERSDQRRRGIALSLTDDDLTDAKALRVRPRQRPEAFTETAADHQPKEASSLSAEAEAELMAELAALEAEESPADAQADTAAEAQAAKAGRAILEGDLIEREDAAIDRLMATTNSKLSDDSVQQKRDQLSHLKAAVAATMADRAAEETAEITEDPDTAYRDDLAKVVRPSAEAKQPTAQERHALALAAKAAREAEENRQKAAPLVLVSDKAPTEDATPKQAVRPSRPVRPAGQPVAPRRINRKDPTKVVETSENKAKFSEYANKVGAQELSDLLEAAGAYLNKVEGKAVFTRPQIMQMVLRQDEGKRFTREDSLRGFDNLVRKGAIQRVDRGQFAIASESRFVN